MQSSLRRKGTHRYYCLGPPFFAGNMLHCLEEGHQVKRGAPDHWKMKELARRLNIPCKYALPWANGVMERLWHYAARYCMQGDIGRVPNEEIAEICCWPRKHADELIEALLLSGWLDSSKTFRLLLHDWPEHCEESVKKTLKNRGLPFLFRENSRNDPEFSACLSLSHSLSHSLITPKRPFPEKPIAADVNGKTSQRFEEWWVIWSKVRGTYGKTRACRAYVSVVSVTLETACFDCTRSYLASLKDPSQGFNPDNFLYEMAREDFTPRWPPRKKTLTEMLEAEEANGTE